MLLHMASIEVPRQRGQATVTVPRAGSVGSKVAGCTGNWRRSGRGSLTSGLCARELQRSDEPRIAFPVAQESRPPADRAYANLCVDVTIGAATGNTEVDEVTNEFERRDKACLSTPT
jgi:hypothetical protein